MHRIEVLFHATVSTCVFLSAEKAQAAYDKISEALRNYKQFKNDRAECVEIEAEMGTSVFKLERMNAVTISDETDREAMMRRALEDEALGHRLRAEIGLAPLKGAPPSPQVTAEPGAK
jgi:phosphopantetheine adenylyltransferase